MRGTSGPRLGAALILAFAAIAGLGAQAPASPAPAQIRYRFESLPADPSVGDLVRVVFVVAGLGGSGLRVDVELDEGLTLEASSERPRVGAGGSRETEIVLELRVLAAGRRVVGDIEVEGAGGSILIPGFSLSARGPGGRGPEPSVWRWSAPFSVFRFEAFELAIERVDGSGTPADAAASFSPPPGLSLETAGALSWVALALEEGEIALPEVTIFAGSSSIGSAGAAALRAKSLPADLEASRAIGRFRAELIGPDPELAAGRASDFSLLLSGKGNLPLVLLPEARVELEGETLPRGSVIYSREDDARPSGGSYEGSASLHIRVAPALPGRLILEFPPLPVLEPGGALSWLSLPRFEALVAGSAAPLPAAGRASPFAALLAATAPGAESVAPGAAPGAVSVAPGAADAALFEAAQAWEKGERGRALALLYGIQRRRPGERTSDFGFMLLSPRLSRCFRGRSAVSPPHALGEGSIGKCGREPARDQQQAKQQGSPEQVIDETLTGLDPLRDRVCDRQPRAP